jgi:predicted DNA-binding transcriptional regulator YafY
MRTTRLFQLLDLLRATTRPVQARTLASTLEVSERTIYRDVVTLQAIGAPVRGEPGIGYQLEPGFFLPPLHLDVDEMDAVRFGLRLTAARGDARLREAAERAAGKIAAVLNGGDRVEFLDAPFRAASKMDRRSLDHDDKLACIRGAIKRRALLEIAYLDLNDRRTQRTCRPLGLTVFDEVWLLTIWCEMRQSFRNLRIDRIEHVESRGKAFRHEKGKRFVDYLNSLDSTD